MNTRRLILNMKEYIKKKKRWALVDKEGNIVETFRNSNTLRDWKGKLEKQRFEQLKIIELDYHEKDK